MKIQARLLAAILFLLISSPIFSADQLSMGKLFQTLVLCRPTYHRPKGMAHGQSLQNILKHLEIGREASKVKK